MEKKHNDKMINVLKELLEVLPKCDICNEKFIEGYEADDGCELTTMEYENFICDDCLKNRKDKYEIIKYNDRLTSIDFKDNHLFNHVKCKVGDELYNIYSKIKTR